MDNKKFDDIIKKKLESLSSGATDDGWELFREKWERSTSILEDGEITENQEIEDNTDDLFDAKVKQNMRGLRMPFNSAHWVRLKAQLEAEALFKKRLFVAKTVEILMLTLIVLVVLNVWPIQNNLYQLPIFDMPMVPSVQVDKATADKYAAEHDHNSAKQTAIINKVIAKANTIGSTFFLNGGAKSTKSKSDAIKSKNIEVESIEKVDLNFLFPFLQTNENTEERNSTEENVESATQNYSITDLLLNDISPMEIPQRPMGYPDITLGLAKEKTAEKSFVSLAIGPKVNLVNSPFDPVYKLDPYNTLNTNFNITAKIHKEVGPVELYTGVGYTNTSYAPLIIEELYKNQKEEYNQASLENIAFKTINVPVGVNYNLVYKNHFQLYASAGVDVNLITHSEYEVYDLPANEYRSGNNFSSKSPDIGKTEINQRALLSQKEFNSGILQGGTLRDNMYATASLGIGMVTNISNRASIFVEPKYSHFISSQGLGPNLDKVHAVSVDLGLRYQLN